MAWIYLAESVELASPSATGSDQWHIAKLIPIVKESSYQELKMEILFKCSNLGRIFKRSTSPQS